MTRIAVLADVHSNVAAFEAVMADVVRQAPDEVLLAGDLVGRGPEGRAVTRMAADEGLQGVRGNHEDYLLAFRRDDVPDPWRTGDPWSAARWMARELGYVGESYVGGWPFALTAASNERVGIVHGTPASNQSGIGPWSTLAEQRRALDSAKAEVLVCAHTHRPHVRRIGGRMLVNAGSVGMPFDGDPRARYVLLTRRRAGWHVEHRAVSWDRQRLLRTYRTSGFLAAGGVTSVLLALEVRLARSLLTPFLTWAASSGRSPDEQACAEYVEGTVGLTITELRAAGEMAPAPPPGPRDRAV